jgi:hypothetical protein
LAFAAGRVSTVELVICVVELALGALLGRMLAAMVSVPELLTLPALSTLNSPKRFVVEVAMKRPSARRLEVVEPLVTVAGLVNAVLVKVPPPQPVQESTVMAAKVLAPKALKVPEALTLPELSTKKRPERLVVEVARERRVGVVLVAVPPPLIKIEASRAVPEA